MAVDVREPHIPVQGQLAGVLEQGVTRKRVLWLCGRHGANLYFQGVFVKMSNARREDINTIDLPVCSECATEMIAEYRRQKKGQTVMGVMIV